MQCAMATWSFFRILACLVWSGRLLLQLYHLCTLEPPHVIMYIRLHTYHSNWITLYMHSVTPPTFLSSTPSLPCPSLPLLPISFALLSSLAFSYCLLFSPSLPPPFSLPPFFLLPSSTCDACSQTTVKTRMLRCTPPPCPLTSHPQKRKRRRRTNQKKCTLRWTPLSTFVLPLCSTIEQS